MPDVLGSHAGPKKEGERMSTNELVQKAMSALDEMTVKELVELKTAALSNPYFRVDPELQALDREARKLLRGYREAESRNKIDQIATTALNRKRRYPLGD
jgi:hypothetical protein